MRFTALCLVSLFGCSSPVITKESTDEVGGTCTFTAKMTAGVFSGYEEGEQTLTVRPYAADDRACEPSAKVECDTFRSLCTSRIGFREHVYETVGRK